jgi:hypothetical protein
MNEYSIVVKVTQWGFSAFVDETDELIASSDEFCDLVNLLTEELEVERFTVILKEGD